LQTAGVPQGTSWLPGRQAGNHVVEAARSEGDSVAELAIEGREPRVSQIKMSDEDELVEQRRFMAVCWGPGDPATTFVMLDHAGQLIDTLFAGQLSGNVPRTRPMDNNPSNDPLKVGGLPAGLLALTQALLCACTTLWLSLFHAAL
jgi:hypothetical protein